MLELIYIHNYIKFLGDFLDKIIEYMLAEDEGFGDITSDAVVEEGKVVNGSIVSKDNGVLAGIDIIHELFEEFGVKVLFWMKDGAKISPGDVLMSFVGEARSILLLERTALNLLMRMSGVATAANHYVNLIGNSHFRIAGTRKTSPAIGKFDKYALKVGGADTHRFSLDDMVLIKDNHIASCGLTDFIDCVKNGADIVMLDNMNSSQVKEVIDKLNELNIRQNSLIEVSGGITEKNISDYADLGVDIISIGALTHSSRSLNFSLRIEEQSQP